MATIQLFPDFKEFLKLLISEKVEFLIVGSYAVGFHGYVRGTNDLDLWVRLDRDNAERIVRALRAFGFDLKGLSTDLFLRPDKVTRMGIPPFRIEILTGISGVEFDECYAARVMARIDDLELPFISREHLKINKAAAGRKKDLADLDELP